MALRQASQQRGVALILVLLVVAIVAILATEVSSRVQFNIQRAQNSQQHQQAYWYALGGEQVARQILYQSLSNEGQVHLSQRWAQPTRYSIDGGHVEIAFRDLNACININQLSTLTDNSSPTLLLRQLRRVIQEASNDDNEAQLLVEALRDWIDKDLTATGLGGAEDLYYSAQDTPYLSASGPVADLSEMRLVAGFTDQHLRSLRPYLCALPALQSQINVNTLTQEQAPLLSALFEQKLSTEEAESLIGSRPAGGFKTVDQFWEALPLADEFKSQAVKEQLAVRSQFFVATITVSHYDSHFSLSTHLQVKENNPLPYRRQYGEQP